MTKFATKSNLCGLYMFLSILTALWCIESVRCDNITIRNIVHRQVHHKPQIDSDLNDIDHTEAIMTIIMIIAQSMMMNMINMIMMMMMMMTANMNMITIINYTYVSLGNGCV